MLSFSQILSLTIGGVLAVVPAGAAQSQPDSTPAPAANSTVLRTNANLVLVDVVVTNHGQAIQGLGRDQFHIFENGHEQTISSFDEHRTGTVLPSSGSKQPALPPHTFSNVPTYPEAPAVNVVLLDGLNTLLPDQMQVRRQMLQFMGQIPAGTSLAVFTLTSRLRMIEGFTTDPARLTRAFENGKLQSSVVLDPLGATELDSATGELANMGASSDALANMQQFVADMTAYQTDQRVAMTLEAMQQLARYLNAIPGRKNLIWFSGSFPIALDPDDSLGSPFEAMRTYADDVQQTSELLAAARVAVYPVDARGLLTLPSTDVSKSSASSNLMSATSNAGRKGTRKQVTVNRPSFGSDDSKFMQQLIAEQATMKQIAEQTGGQEYINTNGLKEAIGKAIQNGSEYYTIGYIPTAGTFDGKFRSIQVKSAVADAKLEYRRGYYASDPDKASEHNPGKASLINSATLVGAPPATQIPFRARILPAVDPALAGSKLPTGAAGEMTASLKGPVHRYIVDFTVDANGLAYQETADGVRVANVELVLVGYDAGAQRVNYLDRGFKLSLKPESFAHVLATGIPVRMALDLPEGEVRLHMAVHDLTAARIGSLEVPLKVAAQ
jgi:VWFA-related protein